MDIANAMKQMASFQDGNDMLLDQKTEQQQQTKDKQEKKKMQEL